jgi:hypothetical protein
MAAVSTEFEQYVVIAQSGGRRETIHEGRGWQQWEGMTTTMTMHSNYINIKSTLYAYLIATHDVPQKLAYPSNINLIFMDVMC